MLAIIGIIGTAIAIIGGFVMEGGHLMVLFQPAEFLIIGGAALCGLLIGTPTKYVRMLIGQLTGILGGSHSKQDYLDLLVMLYELFTVARKEGLMGLEKHVERPEESQIFQKYPKFLKDHHARDFLCDTMRLIISGAAVTAYDLEALMDNDLEIHHKENAKPSGSLLTVADTLPGLGIVAAVLGVVIAMGAIDGPPEELGHKVAAALVGTFLGVLLSYGFVGPLGRNLESTAEQGGVYYECLKQALIAFHKGFVGTIAVEFARRVIPGDVRPGFTELEEACRAQKG
jgi:chemotaxis protein MotA